jgi:hypothetical protein
MSTDRDTTRIVRSWLRSDENDSADRVLGAVLDRLNTTPQRRATAWPTWRPTDMNNLQRFVLAAAVVTLAVLGLGYATGARTGAPSGSASPSASSHPSEVAIASLPALQMPGTRVSPAGDYGWQAAGPDVVGGMHRVVEDRDGAREATAMIFAVGPECLADQQGGQPSRVTVAGLEGTVIDQYQPVMPFNGVGDEITRAHALTVGDRTLCVFVTWHPTTSEDELRAALEIVDTIRAQPVGRQGIRITFRLPDGWDTG